MSLKSFDGDVKRRAIPFDEYALLVVRVGPSVCALSLQCVDFDTMTQQQFDTIQQASSCKIVQYRASVTIATVKQPLYQSLIRVGQYVGL